MNMDHRVVHIHPEAPVKPALGAACNGCGVCCLMEPCPLGMLVSRRRSGACKALQWDTLARRYQCGIVTDAAGVMGPLLGWMAPLTQRLAMRWISAGSGCDADIEVGSNPHS